MSDEMLKRAAEWIPALRERSIEIDSLRQLPQDLAEALAADGFYRTLVPAELGGLGLPPAVVAEISEVLAMGNASAAWCTFIGATSQIMFAALEPAQLAEVLDNPDVITAGVFAHSGTATAALGPNGADGYRVQGRWAWASGSHNSEWISGGVQIDSGDGPQPALGRAFFRPDDIELHDDWYTSGLRGSGSSTFEAHDVWLPASRIAYERTILKSPYAAEPLYRMPLFGLLALPIGAIALGMARACVDEVIDVAKSKVPQGSRRTLGQRPSLHSAVAVADTEVRAARNLLYASIDAAWERAQHGLSDLELRRDLRTATTHAMQTSLRVTQSMNAAVGGTAVFEASPLQRHLRDAQTASAHFMVAMPVMELAGRTYFDPEADTSGL
ncbi:MAG: acyl-CoA dehydrogenase family protein [Acidimicrobiaceae bacterium]|uniref:acyl-CoA dehydrogenase family protein n=1 Tax=Candidatus Poriferisodalis multihospitum TaxID=2983191 RepID=UPI0022A59739|nr:acyl-CoA dehydrogenase family protein [Candidatus Poriferisodalis multihospitum]MCY3608076.1 acyl-CoA dehydrogenase family protein [Acidimicrobiaceae bacterium]MDE0321925.1 acyl-CoA dehydrogenase family protein [Acidimicrobiaceae bacterium]